MIFTRNFSSKAVRLLDELLPPIIRDRSWFLAPIAWILYGKRWKTIFKFRDKAFTSSWPSMVDTYHSIKDIQIHGGSDINDKCVKATIPYLSGLGLKKEFCEIGCGNGNTLKEIRKHFPGQITGCDFIRYPEMTDPPRWMDFVVRDLSAGLPIVWQRRFDVVLCAHTLEHVRDIRKAMDELRRITKTTLIVVLPRQRPYRYMFNMHVHFFPYEWSLYSILGSPSPGSFCKVDLIDGDWFYVETRY